VSKLRPRSWPVRWRIAAASAGLTLFILIAFSGVVGRLVSNRISDDFHDDLETTANELAFDIELAGAPCEVLNVTGNAIQQVAMADGASVRIVSPSCNRVIVQTPDAPNLGITAPGVRDIGDYAVATSSILTSQLGYGPTYVQYARSTASLDATIERLWLFLGAGILGATVFAGLAGLAVADRAMRPIAALTSTAREIASTRDPSKRIPQPELDDEVGELARTLDEMLRELDAARAETQSMIQAQRDFVADASHELRTPLTSILANLELLQGSLADGVSDAEDMETVHSALRSSRRMSRLVGDLLILARADAGRSAPRERIDLTEIAVGAVAEIEPTLDGRNLVVELGDEAPIEGNADELHRLTVNLLDNAASHTPPGTAITIRVAREGADAVLEVADDGPGIPPGMEEQVFSRFVRGAGPADLNPGNGTGLGLSIVRSVAESHGGRVEASNRPEGGALFRVTLPAAQPEPARTEEPSVPAI
jgi:signal transduction histidine kinase